MFHKVGWFPGRFLICFRIELRMCLKPEQIRKHAESCGGCALLHRTIKVQYLLASKCRPSHGVAGAFERETGRGYWRTWRYVCRVELVMMSYMIVQVLSRASASSDSEMKIDGGATGWGSVAMDFLKQLASLGTLRQ